MMAKLILLVLAATSIVIADTGLTYAQALVTYDAFTSGINPARWYPEVWPAFGGIQTDAQRLIVNGQARITNRTWGRTSSNSGGSYTINYLVAQKSPGITVMRGTITPRVSQLIGCVTNSGTPAAARARMTGLFFNIGESIAGNRVDDVFAGVDVYRLSNSVDAAGVLRVEPFVGICLDETCANGSGLGSMELGTTSLNTPTTVEVRWDPANNRFTFQLNADAPVSIPYTVPDSRPASSPVKAIGIINSVPRCTITPRPMAYMVADFDNILVNSSALLAPTLTDAGVDPEADVHVDEPVGSMK